ncbi:hypothetical protein Tco_0087778 [Tanacetum coccineum]
MGKAIVKLVKKVKKMEVVLKRRHVVLTDLEDEDAGNSSKQRRNLQEEGLDKMVRSIIKEKSKEFETPTQGKTSGEADISPEGLEAAETTAKVLTQRTKLAQGKLSGLANRGLSSKVLSIDFSSDDFAKKMVELINEKKRLYKEQRERYRRNKPMTQAEQREYMIKYLLKKQGRKSLFLELQSLKHQHTKRTCINLQAKVFKKQNITNVHDVTKDESKNKSESARSDTEEDVEAYMDEGWISFL